MNRSQLHDYLLSRPDAELAFPFGPDVAVYKVGGRMFALLATRGGTEQVNLKCDPHEAVQLRDLFESVLPGYHMNKKHWNTVLLDGSVPRGELERMVDRSYGLVIMALKKSQREALLARFGAAAIFR